MAMDDNALSTILAARIHVARSFHPPHFFRARPPNDSAYRAVNYMACCNAHVRLAVARRLIHERGNRAAIAINLTIMRHDDRGRPRYTCGRREEHTGVVCSAEVMRERVCTHVHARVYVWPRAGECDYY